MIRFLNIRDLAIVDKVEIEFEPGFNVLTGETGAGKSIIVGALGLLVGGRTSGDVVRTGCDKAVVQATFETETGAEIIVRREISARGRSRFFIDDALASSATLRALGTGLVDLHGQHAHQALLDANTHVGLLDTYARVGSLVDDVTARYEAWRRAKIGLEQAIAHSGERKERVEFLTFQLGEIERANPEAGEDDRLDVERGRLANADRLRTLSSEAYATLYDRDDSVVAALGAVWRQVDDLESLDPGFGSFKDARHTVNASLDDLAHTLRSYTASIDIAPDRLGDVEARLADLERLKRKYGGSLDSVLARRDTLHEELDQLAGHDNTRDALEAELSARREDYLDRSTHLSERRRAEAPAFADALEAELAELAIADSRFEIRVVPDVAEAAWAREGTDRVEFFFSANPGEAPRPLARVASGGELSRVMLALKTLASTDVGGKTLVFDEVDAGVGGHAADRVGERLRHLGERFQVLCVTHTPQVAAHATTHFSVGKQIRQGRTNTVIRRFDDEQGRAAEIARLMTGSAAGAALASASELLRSKQMANREPRKGERAARTHG